MPIKVLTYSSFDLIGGAAKAAFRLSGGLRDAGLDVRLRVRRKTSDAFWVTGSAGVLQTVTDRLRPTLDRIPLHLYPSYRGSPWSNNLLPRRMHWREELKTFAPDVVHVHWVGNGFLPISAIGQFSKPLVWTLHDSWAFTGGCHVPANCSLYSSGCGRCPQLGSERAFDLSKLVWKRKQSAWRNSTPTIVAPSHWLASCARQSRLFREADIRVIPNGLDLALFRPMGRMLGREVLNLPPDKKLILFAAMSPRDDPNKGVAYLREAIERIAQKPDADGIEVVLCGASQAPGATSFALPARYVGQVRDDATMALLYSAADVTVVPSRSENLSNTIMESMACGTPVACFCVGGNADMVEHLWNGYLASPFDTDDLARGIVQMLNASRVLRDNARSMCERNFDLRAVSSRYSELFADLRNVATVDGRGYEE